MNEFIKKLIERLESEVNYNDGAEIGSKQAIEIVNQLAEEYNNESVNGDLISRSAVIKLIESKCVDGCLEQNDITLIDAYGLADDVSDLPTAHNDGWIECCPLKALPEKKTDSSNDTAYDKAVKIGYNACIDELLEL